MKAPLCRLASARPGQDAAPFCFDRKFLGLGACEESSHVVASVMAGAIVTSSGEQRSKNGCFLNEGGTIIMVFSIVLNVLTLAVCG